MAKEVYSGCSESSKDEPLYFEEDKGHRSFCVIIYNATSQEAHMIHVSEAAYLGLAPEQTDEAEEFLKKPGDKYAVKITDLTRSFECTGGFAVDTEGGGQDVDIRHYEEDHRACFQLEGIAQSLKTRLRFAEDIEVNVGAAAKHWAVLFDPKSREAKITDDSGNELEWSCTLFGPKQLAALDKRDNIPHQPNQR